MDDLPRLCLIGHTDYSLKLHSSELTLPFGEVNNAAKLYNSLRESNIPCTKVLDLYELFEISNMNDEKGSLFVEMMRINYDLGCSGVDFITDFDNALVRSFRKNLESHLSDHSRNVLLFLSWPGKVLSALSTGIQRAYPTIGKDDSYIKATNLVEPFPMKEFAKEVNLLIGESLLGAVNCALYSIPESQFLLVPNLAPSEADEFYHQPETEKRAYKDSYLAKVAEENKKTIRRDAGTVVIGCPSRCVRRKNIDALIYTVAELYKKYPNILLVLRGDMDSEFDSLSLYSEKLYQLIQSAQEQPWFLWDRNHTSYPEVLKVYGSFDICALLSGAELGSNTVVEVCAMGIPTVLLDASVNPYLYKGMVEFVRGGDLCSSTWIYPQPEKEDLYATLSELICSPEKRTALGERGRQLAFRRFNSAQLAQRLSLASRSAWSFFHKDSQEEEFRNLILLQLKADQKEFE